MSYILNIETATRNCSVAVSKNGEVLLCRETADEGYSHAEKLHQFIESTLSELQLSYTDLSAVAVSQGPGSYTGLRIGVSAAKGLCFALHIPLIAVDTLKVLASQVQAPDGVIVPMIDARRMEAYTAIFNSELEKVRETQAEILTVESFSGAEGKVYFAGDCLEKAKTVLTDSRFVFLDEVVYPSAGAMARLSWEQYQKDDTVDVAYFQPFYLKDFIVTGKKSSAD